MAVSVRRALLVAVLLAVPVLLAVTSQAVTRPDDRPPVPRTTITVPAVAATDPSPDAPADDPPPQLPADAVPAPPAPTGDLAGVPRPDPRVVREPVPPRAAPDGGGDDGAE